MQPSSAGGGEGSKKNSTAMKRYGPIVAIVAVVAIGVGILVATSGDDDEPTVSDSAPVTEPAPETTVAETTPATEPAPETTAAGGTETTAGSTDTTTPTSEAPAEITFPLSFSQAEEQGITVDWGDRCDPETGLVAVPDFFAPECFAPFTGDNGGETFQGVTEDEIVIAVYQGIPNDPIIAYISDAVDVDDTNEQAAETMQGMVDYFQTYYETYGRTVKLNFIVGTGLATDETAARADAVRIAEEVKPFMVWGGPALTSAFADELSAHGIACIACTPPQPPEFYVDRDPLMWGIATGGEQSQVHILEMIEKQLAGRNAEHAGDEFVNTPRKFGLLYIESSLASKELADNFEAGMASIGAPLAERVAYALDPATIQATASQAIAKFKAAGVTSIVFSGDPVAPRDFTREATAQGYFPEWIIGSSALVDLNAFGRTYDQEQWKHAFGFSQLAARVTPEISGYFALYRWFTGQDPPAIDTVGLIAPFPALFFAVNQLVGPNLTQETWKAALFAGTQSQTAITQPSLGWGDKGIWPDADYLGIDDGTLIWWDPTATGPDEIRKQGTGMYQFVDGGARYLPGGWPAEDKFFNPDGAVAIYEVAPESETPPSYPSPAG